MRSSDLAIIPRPVHELARPESVDLVAAFLTGRSPRTIDSYQRDLADFARFLGCPGARDAVAFLLASSPGDANLIALSYRNHMTERELAPATIARRLAALRSVVKLAKTLGRVNWTLEVASPRTEAYRDTTGPGLSGWRSMLDLAKQEAKSGESRAVRDLALVRLMHDLGLRRGEAAGLDLKDVDLEAGTVAVIGKGKREPIRMTLPDPVRRDLAAWIDVRGSEPGPLFMRHDRARNPAGGHGRLTGRAIHMMVRALGKRAGLGRPTRPHGLRHEAITTALDRTGDVRSVQKFSRHSKLETLMRYDDNRRDAAGAIARTVSED